MANFKSVEAALKYFNTKYGNDPRYYWNSLPQNVKSNLMKDSFGYKKEVSFDELKKAINNRLFKEDGSKKDFNMIKKYNNYDTNSYYDRKAANNRKYFGEKEEKSSKNMHDKNIDLEKLGDEELIKGYIPRDGKEIPEELVNEVVSLLSRNMGKKNSLQNAIEDVEIDNPFKDAPVKTYNDKEKTSYWLFDMDKPKEEVKQDPFKNLSLRMKYNKNFDENELFSYIDDFVNNSEDKYYLENSELPDVMEYFRDFLRNNY